MQLLASASLKCPAGHFVQEPSFGAVPALQSCAEHADTDYHMDERLLRLQFSDAVPLMYVHMSRQVSVHMPVHTPVQMLDVCTDV